MKTLKKIEKKVSALDSELAIHRTKESIAREYYVLRDDVFDFLGIFNATPTPHNFADLQLSNEK